MRSLLVLSIVLTLGCQTSQPGAPSATRAVAQSVEVSLVNGSVPEQQTREQLRRLLERFDVGRWTYTQAVQIDEQAIPHSHPVLTLHTRHLDSDMQLLSTYVHEQMHWFVDANPAGEESAKAELRGLYPTLPVGFPEGASDLQSSYLHLIVNYLEYAALQRLAGKETARSVFDFWANDHYRELYRIVLKDEARIRELVGRHGLLPEGL
ncbi:hypothetical protein JY651_20880 [Pyxidicoccus parkwayensis]|uniref:Lipoprotein n=1 Tax=Pyxidicoccus parkwayensis TaxID=2813578 RepID=A0ABX7P9V0_9BACT|nr:hypothetical protein [Pyxidicoccus parkwaysis]QSQ27216.1 hypothetical protein JY651_20880 [Pyxidicoccus parkwaysis]